MKGIVNIIESTAIGMNRSEPRSYDLSDCMVDGNRGKRLIIILTSPGCNYYKRQEGGCVFCGFNYLTSSGEMPTPSQYADQIQHATHRALAGDTHPLELDVYNSGNFFNDAELTPEARRAIASAASSIATLRIISVDSRPEFLTSGRLQDWVRSICKGGKATRLEVGIGLEVFSDQIRTKQLKKCFERVDFERAVGKLAEVNIGVLAYIMLKPCPMTDEEALDDAVLAAEYVATTAARFGAPMRIALEPTFVVKGTDLARLEMASLYAPPNFNLVIEAVKRIHGRVGPIRIGLWEEDLPTVHNGQMNSASLSILKRYNLSGDVRVLSLKP